MGVYVGLWCSSWDVVCWVLFYVVFGIEVGVELFFVDDWMSWNEVGGFYLGWWVCYVNFWMGMVRMGFGVFWIWCYFWEVYLFMFSYYLLVGILLEKWYVFVCIFGFDCIS